jgi:hypothetical protein
MDVGNAELFLFRGELLEKLLRGCRIDKTNVQGKKNVVASKLNVGQGVKEAIHGSLLARYVIE